MIKILNMGGNMIKILTIWVVALCTVGMLSSCAHEEPAPGSASDPSAKKKQENSAGASVGVQQEGVSAEGR